MSAGHMRRWLLGSAALGGAAWVSLPLLPVTSLPHLSSYEWLFLLAPLVIVPLALSLLIQAAKAATPASFMAACASQPVAALATVASFALQPGPMAATLALPWLAVCALVGLSGLTGFKYAPREPGVLAARAGMLYLAVGGVSLALSRAGIAPLHFSEPIVLLTAVHFHFTGFAAAVFAAALTKSLSVTAKCAQHRRTLALATATLISATPLLAVGWLLDSAAWKLVCVLGLAAGISAIATSALRVAFAPNRPLPRILLGIAAGSVLFGMVLAGLYGAGEFAGHSLIGLQEMARLHGTANGIGFSLCGLLGMSLLGEERR